MARFADQPQVQVSVEIQAPPEVVWSLVTDINLPSRFQDEFRGAEWLDPGPALGARFVGKNERKGHRWETMSWVSSFEPLGAFGWAVSDPDHPGATWTFRLASVASGTKLTYHRRLGPGPSGITDIIARHPEREEEVIALRNEEHRVHMQAVVDGIKELAEAADRA
jgi:uncharacterized protein YndB with AHSA1/START domain